MFTQKYLGETSDIAKLINVEDVEKLVQSLSDVRNNKGRLFIMGIGGSEASAAHAVNDFRKICKIESYSVTDNSPELTANINDKGWDNSFVSWLVESNLNKNDAILVFSVGGGNKELGISANIVYASIYAKSMGCKILGVVGKPDGYIALNADARVVVPIVNENHITPHGEEFQSVILHLLASHPLLKINETTWESKR